MGESGEGTGGLDFRIGKGDIELTHNMHFCYTRILASSTTHT